MSQKTVYWLCQALGWGIYSAVGMMMAVRQVGWTTSVILGYAAFFLYSIALTDWLRREIKRRQWLEARPAAVVTRLAAAALAVGTLQTLLVLAVSYGLAGDHESFSQTGAVSSAWVTITSATAMWLIFYVALTAPRRYREKEVRLQLALREAELRALEAQINPHFLFNCLNSIRALVVENPPLAQEMVTRFANILRFNLHRDLMHTIPLERELEAVRDYLALEKVRFEDRLRVEFQVDAAAGAAPVPPMLLQTLVENALKHGIAKLQEGGDVVIRAVMEGGAVRVEVENTGFLPEAPGVKGLGLSNVRERLRILYGDRARLELSDGAGNRVLARAVIPTAV